MTFSETTHGQRQIDQLVWMVATSITLQLLTLGGLIGLVWRLITPGR